MPRIRLILPALFLLTLAACSTPTLPPKVITATPERPQSPERVYPGLERLVECEVSGEQLSAFPEPEFDDLWNRLRAGYSLGGIQHPRIDKHLDWYLKHPSYMARVSERGSRYLFYILEQIEARGMPMELALLPIVESAFDPFAYSHGRASGMWQFIPGTGRQYGLKQNWWYDGRRDVVASTNAALDYLSDLHRRMGGDWLLALASYNTGEGNVRKAIRKNKRQGLPTDFWSLRLPRETRAYVPQLLALSRLVMYPESYQVQLSEVPNKPYFDVVDTGGQIDLAQAADLAEMDINDLYKLNPGFNRWATDPKGPHRLLVPVAKAEGFRRNLQQLPLSARVSWERYKIKSGDSLIAIAKRFDTTPAVLREHNNIRGNNIRAGKMMLIPKASASAKHYAYSEDERLKRTQSKRRGGESARKIQYTVKSGDSLWTIARAHGVNVSQLAKWNGMAPKDTLRVKQKLVIWKASAPVTQAKMPRNTTKPVVRKLAYKVRKGDSLARIAGKFNLSVNEILAWNPIKKNGYIHPGQSLTLFVDVTRTN
jgi:membrane-bound lytic murein transglycosylase D